MTETDVKVIKQFSPHVHQFGKLMAGTIAGFATSKLAEKVYDAALECYRQKRSAKI